MGAAAIAGAVPQVVTLGMNIDQLIGSKEAEQAATEKFDTGVQEIKNRMERNVAEQINVSDEATKLKNRQNLAAVQQISDDLGQRGQRAVIGGVGGLTTASDAAAEQERQRLGVRLEDRDKAIIGQEEVLRKEQQAFGIEMAALAKGEEERARQEKNAALGGIIKGAGSLASGLIKDAPLYRKNREARQAGKLVDSLGGDFEGLSRNQALDAVSAMGYDPKTLRAARKDGGGGVDVVLRDYYSNLYDSPSAGLPMMAPTGFTGTSLTPTSLNTPSFLGGGSRTSYNAPTSLNTPSFLGGGLPGMAQAQGYFPQTTGQIFSLNNF